MKTINEEYAALRVTLESTLTMPAIVVVGSATDEDEPGVVAGNLSKAFAEAGYRTVVVDPYGGDMLKDELGLKVPIASEIAAIPTSAVNGSIKNLSAVAVSKSAPQTTTSFLKLRSILSELRSNYDVTIINAGVIGANPLALQFAAGSQGVILGFRFGRKPAGADHELMGALRHVGASILGVVAIGRRTDRRPEPAVRAAIEMAPEAAVGPVMALPTLPIVTAGEVVATR